MRKIRNRASILFFCFIIINSNFIFLVGNVLIYKRNSTTAHYRSLNLDDFMNLPTEQDIFSLINSHSIKKGNNPKTASLSDDAYPNWWIEAIGAEDLNYNGSGVRVAILDTGIYESSDYNVVAKWDFIENESTTFDGYGHGTHVAGIIAGNGGGSSGKYRGVAPGASLIDVKIANTTGSIETEDVIEAINWCADPAGGNADIISMSFGYSYPDVLNDITEALSNATQKGVICVASAGNSGPDYYTGSYPAAGIDVITVGATDENNRLATFSSWGPSFTNLAYPDVVAPGVNIISAEAKSSYMSQFDRFTGNYFEFPGNADYIPASGTSMSCPMVAGALALLLEAYPSITPETARIALIKGSQPLTSNSDNDYLKSGVGLINVSASLKYLENKFGDKNDIALILPDFLPVKPYDLLHFPGDHQRFNLTIISGKNTTYDVNIPAVEGVSLLLDKTQVNFVDAGVNHTSLDIKIEENAEPGIRTFELNVSSGGSLYDSINISLDIRIPEFRILMESYHGLNDWFPAYSFYQMGFYEAMKDMAELNVSVDYQMEYWTPDYDRNANNSILTEERLAQYDLVVLQNPILPYSTLEVNSLKRFHDTGGNILFLGTRYQDLCIESINKLFSTLEVDIQVNEENIMDESWIGIGASVSSQSAIVNINHALFNGVRTFYWAYGNSFTTSGDAESIAFIDGKAVAAAYNGSSQGKGSVVAFGDLYWIFNKYTSSDYIQDHSKLLNNLINYYFDENNEPFSLNIGLSSERTSNPQVNISLYVKNQTHEVPLNSSFLNTLLSVSIYNSSNSYPLFMNSTISGIATNYTLNLSDFFNPSSTPLEIEANLTIGSDIYRKTIKLLYFDESKVPNIITFQTNASSINREEIINLNSTLSLTGCNVSGYMGINSYSFFNSKQTINKTLVFTNNGDNYYSNLKLLDTDPSGYAITYIVPESLYNYTNPYSPRVLFRISNRAPEIIKSSSNFNYGQGDISFSETIITENGKEYSKIYTTSQLTRFNFSVNIQEGSEEDSEENMRVFVNFFICAKTIDDVIILLYPENYEVTELSFNTNRHTGSYTIPLTIDFSTLSGVRPVSTVASYYSGYVGLFYVTVYDSEGGTDDYYFIVDISAASPTFDPIIALIIFGIIIAVSLIVILAIYLNQRGKSRRSTRSQYYQEYYYASPEERQDYQSEYYSEKIPMYSSEFQQGSSYFCPFCGKPINVARKYCPHCGESLMEL